MIIFVRVIVDGLQQRVLLARNHNANKTKEKYEQTGNYLRWKNQKQTKLLHSAE